jgi:hypothetical protein
MNLSEFIFTTRRPITCDFFVRKRRVCALCIECVRRWSLGRDCQLRDNRMTVGTLERRMQTRGRVFSKRLPLFLVRSCFF